MDRDQCRDAQRHVRQSSRRAVIAIGALAVWLASLSFYQSATWTSEIAVWTQVQRIAPDRPDGWIEGAMALMDAPGNPRDPVRLRKAEEWVWQAQQLIARAPRSPERAWAIDATAATMAVIRLRQGRLQEAARLMAFAPLQTARGQLCAHFWSVCVLAYS